MITKTFEIRDRATFIAVLAVKLEPECEEDRYLFARSGYGVSPVSQAQYIFVCRIAGGEGRGACDPYEWGTGARTMAEAHKYIAANFDKMETGEVVDVEYILGETKQPKLSERLTAPC